VAGLHASGPLLQALLSGAFVFLALAVIYVSIDNEKEFANRTFNLSLKL